MQYQYKQSLGQQQYKPPSVVDTDGFPTTSSSSFIRSAPAPAHRTTTTEEEDPFTITRNNNVSVTRKLLEPTSSIMVGDWGTDSTVASSSYTRGSTSHQNHDRLAMALAVATTRDNNSPQSISIKPPQPTTTTTTTTLRDQQIFRRPGVGASLSRSFDSSRGSGSRSNEPQQNNNIIRTVNRQSTPPPSTSNTTNKPAIIFQPYDVSNDNSPPRRTSRNVLDNIVEAAASATPAPASAPEAAQDPSQGSNTNFRTTQSKFQSSTSIAASQMESSSKSYTTRSDSNSSSTQRQQAATTSASPSTPSPTLLRNRSGMVNKLKDRFEKKLTSLQQQNQSPLEMAKAKLKQTMGVQFQMPSQQQQQQPTSSEQNDGNNYPITLSPSRSHAQSSATGYSGESSSYNGVGWPGTVDRRGRAYQMEPSYSESEDESNSPTRRLHHQHHQQKSSTSNNNVMYPSQAYRPENHLQQQQQQMFGNTTSAPGLNNKPSFDGGDSAIAELEAWMSGDGDGDSIAFGTTHQQASSSTHNIEKSSGPVDLDEEYDKQSSGGRVDLDQSYERRFDRRKNNDTGWREGRYGMLQGISETKTAADLHLESALGISPSAATAKLNNSYPNGSSFKSPSPRNTKLDNEEARRLGIDTSGSEKRVRAAGRRIPEHHQTAYDDEVYFDDHPEEEDNNNSSFLPQQYLSGPQPMTEEALRNLDSRTAPPRTGASMNFRGYCGFLDKTKDVPNLMDDESVASTSADTATFSVDGNRNTAGMGLVLPSITENSSRNVVRRTSTPSSSNFGSGGSDVFDGVQSSTGSMNQPPTSSNFDTGSDVFDGVLSSTGSMNKPASSLQDDFFRLAATNQHDLSHNKSSRRQQAFGESPEDQFEEFSTQFNPFAVHRDSGVQHNARSGAEFLDPSLDISSLHETDSEVDFESIPDLSMYYVEPDLVRKMVRAFRKICTSQMEINSSDDNMLSVFESLVDTKKAFALFEMRSRIMETDIDRGLDRRGGTNVVDDIVLTPYFQAAHRVRDAVIVSKAWRDGATPKDVVTAHLLTRRSAKAYYTPRLIERIRRPDNPLYKQYWLEEVRWLDDTDFMLMKCQSLGAGTMKGFEMFTIGDCQSILLRMTSDNATVSVVYVCCAFCIGFIFVERLTSVFIPRRLLHPYSNCDGNSNQQ